MNQSKHEANTCSWYEARENVRERVRIGFGLSSDWLRKWREIFKPITKRSNAKPKQTQFTFDTQEETALSAAKSEITSTDFLICCQKNIAGAVVKKGTKMAGNGFQHLYFDEDILPIFIS